MKCERFLLAVTTGMFVLAAVTARAGQWRIARPAAILDITTFGGKANDGSDTTPAVRAALEKCRQTKAGKLVFPPGRYDFWPDRAVERYCFVSNNDEGLKRIAFPLDGIENLEIDGQGAQFVFHGWITPFALDRARKITLKNFSVDWTRTFHNEGKVVEVHDDGLTVEFSEAYPFAVRNGILVFTDGKNSQEQQTSVKGTRTDLSVRRPAGVRSAETRDRLHGPATTG